ncbi:MAG: TerC family protein [Acidobacteria bacterium]|nr:TerC family protein [Acidobacteriota bacterium]
MAGFDTQFLLSILTIVVIDLLLSGDNAVVIALAVKSLPQRERKMGIIFGTSLAVVLRIVLTFFAAKLLGLSFVKLVGGLLLLWIAVKLLAQDEEEHHGGHAASSLWTAMTYIVVADVTMSTDNILAIAGASHGSGALLIFGLGLSIPLMLFTSNLLSRFMERYPVIVVIGAAILGRVAGDMIMSDPWVVATLHPAKWLDYVVQALAVVGVVVAGRWLGRGQENTMVGNVPES